MADYDDGKYIYNVLSNDSTITSLIATALYNDLLIPEDEESLETINYYVSGSFNGGLNYFERQWSINCRSATMTNSRNIANAVYSALNRVSGELEGNTYFTIVTVLPTIPPIDDTDVYNTPIELYIRRR